MGTLFFFLFPVSSYRGEKLGNDFLKKVPGETTTYSILGSHYNKRKGFPGLLRRHRLKCESPATLLPTQREKVQLASWHRWKIFLLI